MKSFAALLAAAAAIASVAAQGAPGFTINTPSNLVVCQPILLTWVGGTPPYSLSVLPGNQPSAPALVDLGTQNGNSVTWLVNLPATTSIGFTLRDHTGLIAQTAAVTINNGTDATCVGKALSTSAGAPVSTPPATSPAPPPTSSPPPGTTAAGGAATSKPAGSTTAPAPAKTNAALKQASAAGVAVFGATILSLFL